MRLGQIRTKVDPEAIRAALAEVHGPENHHPFTDLGMIPSARAHRRGLARVRLALTSPSCALKQWLRDDVVAVVPPDSGGDLGITLSKAAGG